MEQGILMAIPRSEREESSVERQDNSAPKLKPVNREQAMWIPVDVEELIGPDHKARLIWDLVGRLDLRQFLERIESRQNDVGAPAWDPRLLISMLVYSYSEGVGSAREMERLMAYEPGLLWLSGLGQVNHHTLSDFRVNHKEPLDELFAQLLAVLESEGYVRLERVMQDGTKIRAQAGRGFRSEGTLQRHLERARQVVKEMGDPRQEDGGRRSRREAARQRAAREQLETLERAAKELEQMQASKKSEKEKAATRVSLTEPEARMMKHGDNGIAPSYNAQLSTDAEQKVIVGCYVTQEGNDSGELAAGLDGVKENLGRYPVQVVADGSYTNAEQIKEMEDRQIDFVGSLPDPVKRHQSALKSNGVDPAFGAEAFVRDENTRTLQCPAGKTLRYVEQRRKKGRRYHQYRALGTDCQQCPFQQACCPKTAEKGRAVLVLMEEIPHVAALRRKMETPEAKEIYKQRGAVAEFPNAWIKERIGLRKFHVRGVVKAGLELLWACFTYNVMQWCRLKRLASNAAAMA